MVTIVKKEPHPSVIKEVICRNCGATLNYVPNEVKSEVHRDYGGGSDTYYFIDCPSCTKKVSVKGY
jgi:RNase P subunit RPR2